MWLVNLCMPRSVLKNLKMSLEASVQIINHIDIWRTNRWFLRLNKAHQPYLAMGYRHTYDSEHGFLSA